jgi:integrase/recombinase XerC/integrase/recombinase XerD
MGTVHRLPAGQAITPAAAVSAYLATLAGPEQAGTRRVYTGVLRAFADRFATVPDVGAIGAADVAEWFTGRWGKRSPSRWNVALVAIRSAGAYWAEQGWVSADLARMLRRRRERPDRDRALSREQVEELLSRQDVPLRDRTLWRLAYETAARVGELLALDVPDLDMPNRCARVRRKGGALDLVVWQTATARLLPRLLKGRMAGPVFLTERRARVQLPPGDIDAESGRARLSYRQAADIFKEASSGATLHQLRHSALTHAAEDGTSTPMLMARSGHTSVRSLAKYARVSAEALKRHQAATDPARRRGQR